MDALRQAVAAGHRDAAGLRDDPALAVLTTRDDFQALLADLKRPAEVQARAAETASPPRPAGPGRTGAEGAAIRAELAASQHAVGLIQLGLGHLDEAARSLTQAFELRESLSRGDPKNVAILMTVTQVYFRKGQAARALEQINRVLASRPDDAVALAVRGCILGRLGEGQQAAADFSTASSLQPDDPEVWGLHGLFLAERGEPDLAASELARAMARPPLLSNDWTYQDPFGLYTGAVAYPDVFERLTRLRPGDRGVWAMRVFHHARRREWSDAAAAAARLNAALPYDHFSWQCEGVLRLWTGDLDGFRRIGLGMLAVPAAATDPMAARRAALTCLLRPDAFPDARVIDPAMATLLSSIPGRASPYTPLTQGLYEYRAGRPESAVEHLLTACSMFADAAHGATVRLVLAMAYQRTGRPAEARRELQRVRDAVEQSGFDPWREGDLPFVWWDWLRLHLLLREAETLIVYDPIFPTDPFAR
jgi:Tfp pilus assembly protein PilF